MVKMLWCPRYNIRGKRVLLSSAFRDLYIELPNHGLGLVLSANRNIVPRASNTETVQIDPVYDVFGVYL